MINSLSLLIIIPLLSMVLLLLANSNLLIKRIALGGSILQLFYSIFLLFLYIQQKGNSQFSFTNTYSWFKSLNIEFSTGIDGISISMILLTSLVVLAGILVSWDIDFRVKEFFILLLLLCT